MFYCTFKRKNFQNFGVYVDLLDPIFVEEISQKFDIISEILSKFNVFGLKPLIEPLKPLKGESFISSRTIRFTSLLSDSK